ncbi:MAG: hypothetical protein H2038_13900 [Brevundimonas sp.]|uniref:hypothetical protein n=1 Tax=Brevundimonas sp. TaxID=1871086 RepID=UPI0017CB25B0|nr:hypothetical protein [Brevundimonas sp.]MBA4805739.1 hypothetical protein [Brevundimonas sp.]
MTRRLSTDRLILVLGFAVLALGALILWLVSRNAFAPSDPTPEQRAAAQVRDILGPDARVRYTEAGRRLAVCGYVEHEGRTVAFISRPNRLMLSTDPLRSEYEQMQADFCPGFLTRPSGSARP